MVRSMSWGLATGLLAASPLGAGPVTLKAGPITHTLTGYKALHVIPASWTVKRFKNIARPKPADGGHVWYVLGGKVTNGDSKKRLVTAGTFKIVDSEGNEYKPDVKNVRYQPKGTGVAFISVEPGATRSWMAFFSIPESATGLVLRANDLTFASKRVAEFSLPDPGQLLAGGGPQAEARKQTPAKTAGGSRAAARHGSAPPAPATSELRLEPLGLTMQAPSGSKIMKVANSLMVEGPGLVVNVAFASRLWPSRLKEAQKEVEGRFSGREVHSETLADGWALTFQSTTGIGTAYLVQVRRTIGGRSYSCETTVYQPEWQAAALDACKSLRP